MSASRAVCLLLLCFSLAAFARGRTGVAPVGLDGFAAEHVDMLAETLVKAGGDLEVAALAYSFNPENPFTNFTRLIQTTLPSLKGRLFLATYLDDGANRRRADRSTHLYFRPKLLPRQFWNVVTGREGARAKKDFLTDWGTKMVQPYYQWAQSILVWAESNGYASKLHLIIIPVLEDNAASAKDYEALLWPTIEMLEGLPVRSRRNPNGDYDQRQRRVESKDGKRLPYEVHTNSKSFVDNYLRKDDVINNDGCFVLYPGENDQNDNCPSISIEQFRKNQKDYVNRQESHNSLLWRKEFNGGPRTVPPADRGPLTPFSDPQSTLRLLRTLQAR